MKPRSRNSPANTTEFASDYQEKFCATNSYYPAMSGPSYGQIHLSTAYDGNGRAVALAGLGGRPLLAPPLGQSSVNGGGAEVLAMAETQLQPSSAPQHSGHRVPAQRRERFLCCCCCVLAIGLLAVSGFLLLSYMPAFRPPPSVTSSTASRSATAHPAPVGCRQSGRDAGPAAASSADATGRGASDTAGASVGVNCLGHACLKAAAEMEEMLNRSVDLCAGDFFAFACDGWLAENHMPPTAAVWSRAERLQLATDGHLREMLEEQGGRAAEGSATAAPSGDGNTWEAKLKAFYEACISVEDPRFARCKTGAAADAAGDIRRGDVGEEPEDHFQSLLNTCQGKRRLSDRVICLQVDLGVDALFKLRVVASAWTPGLQILLLDEYREPDLGDPGSGPAARAGLRSLVATLVDDLGHLGESVGRNYADSVLTVLDSLAEISLPESHPFKTEPQLRAEMLTVAELRQRLEGSLIQFDQLIAYYMHGNPDANVDSVTIAVGNLGYFTKLGSLVKQLRDDDLKKFMEFSVILKYAPFYSLRSRRDLLRYRARLSGQEHAEDDWLPCLRQLRGPGLNAIYYREQGRRLSQDTVSDAIVPYLRTAFVDLVRNSKDVNQLVKDRVIEKTHSMRFLVGYSEAQMTQQFLNKYYAGMAANLTRLEQARMRSRLFRKSPGIEESLDITSVYPIYYYAENTVFLPAAFFQWPFHQQDNMMPYYLKFALIGSAMATEMAKSLDTIGANWEPNGLRSSQRISIVTAEAEACIKSKLTAGAAGDAAPVNAALSAALGLQVATEAYRLYSRQSGSQFSLPTVGYTPAESLFVAFAQSNCGYERPDYLLRQAGKYMSLRQRVHIALQHNSLFRQLFKCSQTLAHRNCLFDNSD